MWHVMYWARGVPQYNVLRTKEKYESFLEYIKKDGCKIQSCWYTDINNNKTILEY